MLFARTRRAAGIGLFVLTILVTPVHICMLQSPELFDVPYWVLILRVPPGSGGEPTPPKGGFGAVKFRKELDC